MKTKVISITLLAGILSILLVDIVNAANLAIPFFSQQDGRWKDTPLDHSLVTIGTHGCALTATTMVVSYYGVETDPGSLNDELTAIGGIDSDGNLDWTKVPDVCGGKVSTLERIFDPDLAKIDAELSQGYPVIAHVTTGQQPNHYIVFWGNDGGGHYFYDPADKIKTVRTWPEGYHGTYSLGTSLRVYYGTEEPVYFADANLKAAVEQALGISDPIPTDMLGLTNLDAHYRGIVDLTGLDYATNLTILELNGNRISDISELSVLTNLYFLVLSNNQISDISVLSDLMDLHFLDLSRNQISDISALSGLTNLGNLNLSDNQINDISVLSGLTNLANLNLSDNQINDISALSGLRNLGSLVLNDNQINDISALSGLTQLKDLGLVGNQISDISSLLGLTNLMSLGLSYNQISDISSLLGLTNLTWLFLSGNQISDISSLLGLTNLTWLSLDYNQISDIYALSGMTNIQEIWMDGNEIRDISALLGLINLKTLSLGRNWIRDISALSGLTELNFLQIYDNQINDISALSGLMNLDYLQLADNQISDISVVSGLTNLYCLSLCDNHISDISALSGLTNLQYLNLRSNPLNEDACNIYIPQILKNNPRLRHLYYDPCTNPDRIIARVCSPVELRVYDSQGRITGLLEGEEKNEIPNSTYLENTVTIFVPTDTYYYEVAGTGEGAYGLNITSVIGGEAVNFEATNLPTSYGTVHQYTIDWDALSTGEEGVTLKIDSDGDGAFEQIVIADNDLSYNEFALQTETVIDFEPDTLNLKSKGKFATVYIELPEGFDVSEIDISSLTLNESITALPKPIAIGDYDSDGTNDLMVKFDLQELIEVLEPGDQMIDLTGRLSDDRPLAGFDMIRVIH